MQVEYCYPHTLPCVHNQDMIFAYFRRQLVERMSNTLGADDQKGLSKSQQPNCSTMLVTFSSSSPDELKWWGGDGKRSKLANTSRTDCGVHIAHKFMNC